MSDWVTTAAAATAAAAASASASASAGGGGIVQRWSVRTHGARGIPPTEEARGAHAERVECRPQRARVAAVRIGIDAAGHAEEQPLRLLRVRAKAGAGARFRVGARAGVRARARVQVSPCAWSVLVPRICPGRPKGTPETSASHSSGE